ncbi:hypothetical protein ABPG75_008720 [Micractinium tetrahymenae]
MAAGKRRPQEAAEAQPGAKRPPAAPGGGGGSGGGGSANCTSQERPFPGVRLFVPSHPHSRAKLKAWAERLEIRTDPRDCTHCVVFEQQGRLRWDSVPDKLRPGGAPAPGVRFVTEKWPSGCIGKGQLLREGPFLAPLPPATDVPAVAAGGSVAAAAATAAAPGSSWPPLRRHSPEPPDDDGLAEGGSSVLSWNIWYDEDFSKERMEALASLVEKQQPTFLLFQEVTHLHWGHLEPLLAPQYHAAFAPPARGCRCFTMLLCRRDSVHNMRAQQFIFEWELNDSRAQQDEGFKRDIKSLSCEVGGSRLFVSTVHLMKGPLGKDQLSRMWEVLSGHPEVNNLVAGDLNWTDPGNPWLPAGWSDVWDPLKGLGEGEGLTFDSRVCNPKGKSTCRQARLDRMFARLADWRPCSIELVGQQPIPGLMWGQHRVWVSDHLGLLARFVRRR